ncbi:hypothetical protein JCM10207_005875 [Rhodosporidiobolus poonsookiae]
MPTSPFSRRPAVSRTYGSSTRRSSGGGRSTSGKGILADSSSEEEGAAGDGKSKAAGAARRGGKGAGSGKGKDGDEDKSKKTSTSRTRTANRAAPAPAAAPSAPRPAPRRTRSSTVPHPSPSLTPCLDADAPAQAEDSQTSSFWDEERAVKPSPSSATAGGGRRRSARTGGKDGAAASPALARMAKRAAGTAEGEEEKQEREEAAGRKDDGPEGSDVEPSSPPPRRGAGAKRARLSAPTGPATNGSGMTGRNGQEEKQEDEEEDEDAVPEPFAYVPLKERLARAAPASVTAKKPSAGSSKADDKPAAPRRARSSAAAQEPISTTTPAPPRATELAPAPAPAPATAVPPPPKPAPTPRPPSPAKDLSALFSRFAPSASTSTSTAAAPPPSPSTAAAAAAIFPPASPAASPSASTSVPARPSPLKRARSAADAPSAAAGVVGRMRGGARKPAVPLAGVPESPRRGTGLERAYSQPGLGSSPSASARGSPSPSPSRPGLGASRSFPAFGRGGSPSPAPGPAPFPAQAQGHSAYRPLPALGFSSAAAGAAGGARTYAALRSMRRDVEEEALFLGEPAGPSASTSSGLGVGLPPSLMRPLGQPLASAPKKAREGYAALRDKWGIGAEEALYGEEDSLELGDSQGESQSQSFGTAPGGGAGRVQGGGTLRKKGEGRRWGDELGWALEGLTDGGAGGDEGAKRASALEILQKTLDREWLRRLKSSGMAERVYRAFRGAGAGEGEDKILDLTFFALLALLLSDQRLSEPLFRLSPSDLLAPSPSRSPSRPASPAPLSRHNSTSRPPLSPSKSFGSAQFSSSPRKRDPAELDERCDVLEGVRGAVERLRAEGGAEEIGVSGGGVEEEGKKGKRRERGEGRQLQTLRNVLDASDLFADDPSLPVTPLSLLLLITRSIASYVPRSIFQPQVLLCTSGVFEGVVHVLLDECGKIDGRIEKYEKGLELLPSSSTASPPPPSLPTALLALSTLDTTSSGTFLALPVLSAPALLPRVAAALAELTRFTFLVALDAPLSSVEDDKQVRATGRQTLLAALGVLFGLSTELAWCAALVEPRGEVLATLVRVVVGCRRATREVAARVKAAGGEEKRKRVRVEELDAAPEKSDDAMPPSPNGGAEDRTKADAEAEEQQLWDILSVALGVLANLLDCLGEEERVSGVLREIELNPECRTRRKCARRCTCPDDKRKPALEILARFAQEDMADAPNSVYQTSTTGFLRLALGLSMLSDPLNEELVLSTLSTAPPLPSTSTSLLPALLDALSDLARLLEERQQAQRLLIAGPPPVKDDDDDLVLPETQLDDADETMELDRSGGADGEGEDGRARRIREMVQRLRRRVAAV